MDGHFLRIVVVAVLMYLLGWFWYSPKVFGKMWCNVCQVKCEGKKPTVSCMISYFIVCLVMAFVVSCFIGHLGITSVQNALTFGFFAWLGFIATTMYSAVIWTKKPFAAYFIDAGYYLVALLVMSVILTLWR